MATIATRLSNTGTLLVNGGFDEVSLGSGSISFNGTNQYLSIPNNSSFNLGSSNFTIEAWVYPTVSGTEKQIITKNDGYPTGFEWNFDILPSYQLLFNGYGTSYFEARSTTTIAINVWTHVASVRNGATITIYINGVASATVSAQTFQTTTANVAVGRDLEATGGSRSFGGYISNIRYIKGTAVYTTNFTPPTSILPAIANTSLLLNTTDSTNFIKDNGPNNFTVTNNNSATFNTSSPFNQNSSKTRTTTDTVFSNVLDEVSLAAGSVSFNGTNQYLTVPASTAFAFGTNDLTIESWCYFFNGTTNITGVICSNYGPSSSWAADSFYFGKHTSYSGKVTFWINNYNSGAALLIDPTLPPDNTWTHYAVTRYGSTWTLWRNGTSVVTGTYAGNPNATKTNLLIGESDINQNYFSGYLSNFRIIKGTALYTASFTPPTSILPAIANTSLLLNVTDSTNFIKDNGPNKFTVTNNNTATFNANGPFNQGVTTIKQRQVTDGTLEVYSNFDEFTGAPVVNGSLQLWLDAGQTTSYPGTGSTWTDLSGKGRNYTLTSGPTYDAINGGSINLAGASQYLASPVYPSATFTGAFSYEVWIKPTSTSGVILTENFTGTSSMTTWFVSLMELVAGSIRVGFWIGSAGYISIGTATANNWHQIVMTYSGTTLTGYVNGSVGNTGTYTKQYGGYGITTAPSTTNFGSGAWYNGKIASMKFYDRALSSDEVSQNFNALRRRYGI